MKRWIIFGLFLLIANPAWAMSIKGVTVPGHVFADGQSLVLNGVGIRTKFFFNIYIGALYLPVKAQDAKRIIASKLPKRISMYFLRGGIGHAMLAAGWTNAFGNELSDSIMTKLKLRIKKFNAMFGETHEGDQYTFDFRNYSAPLIG